MDAKSSAFELVLIRSAGDSKWRTSSGSRFPKSRNRQIPDFGDQLPPGIQDFDANKPSPERQKAPNLFGALATGMVIGAAMLALFATLWFAFVGPSAADIPFEPGVSPTIGDQLERLVDTLYLLGVFVLALAATAAVAGVLAIFSRRVSPLCSDPCRRRDSVHGGTRVAARGHSDSLGADGAPPALPRARHGSR